MKDIPIYKEYTYIRRILYIRSTLLIAFLKKVRPFVITNRDGNGERACHLLAALTKEILAQCLQRSLFVFFANEEGDIMIASAIGDHTQRYIAECIGH